MDRIRICWRGFQNLGSIYRFVVGKIVNLLVILLVPYFIEFL